MLGDETVYSEHLAIPPAFINHVFRRLVAHGAHWLRSRKRRLQGQNGLATACQTCFLNLTLPITRPHHKIIPSLQLLLFNSERFRVFFLGALVESVIL